jgi:WD40 repeat protein
MPAFSQTRLVATYALLGATLLFCGALSLITAQTQDAARLPLQKGHTHAILEVKWSPNDKLLLTYSAADGFLNVWSMPQGKLITAINDSSIKIKGNDKRALRAFAWNDDSRLIASGSENGTAQVWEAETGKLLFSIPVADEYVTGLGFSHDAKYLAAVASPKGRKSILKLLDVATGQVSKELGGIESRFLTYYRDAKLVFSDDNRTLLVGDIGGIVMRWDLGSGSLLSEKKLDLCTAHRRMPNSFAYSDDLSLVVARCGVKTDVIDTNTGDILRQNSISVDFSSSVVVSRDKKFVAIGDSGSLRLLNLVTGTEVTIDIELPITCGCDFSKDNSLLAIQDYFNDETVRLINLNTQQTVTRLEAIPARLGPSHLVLTEDCWPQAATTELFACGMVKQAYCCKRLPDTLRASMWLPLLPMASSSLRLVATRRLKFGKLLLET